MTYFSEHDEEPFILLWFQKHPPASIPGRFLEIGANNGVKGSNARALALQGWHGIAVEADPETFKSLMKNCEGTGVAPLWAAVGREPGSIRFVCDRQESCSGLSSIHITPRQESDVVFVPCVTLSDLWRNHDFVTIDAEGCDVDIICSTDFRAVCPSLIMVETDKKGSKEKIDTHMAMYGYREVFSNIGNTAYSWIINH